MLKVLVWRVSNDTTFEDNALEILERQHDGIEVVGSSTGEDIGKVDWGGVYDVLLCVGAKKVGMSKVTQDAKQLNLPEEKLLGDWIVTIPGFTLKKYRQLQRSRLSIFAMNCFGGMLAHSLGLSTRSPFFNLFLPYKSFLEFLREPRKYMEEKLVFQSENFVKAGNYSYPIVKLGDIQINMMHYKTFEESVAAWERRKPRINWYNLIAIMWSVDKTILKDFDALPYGKKVCFVPFKSDLDSAWYINPEIDKSTDRFDFTVNHFGEGKFFYYDPFDMLLYGKKTPLIEM